VRRPVNEAWHGRLRRPTARCSSGNSARASPGTAASRGLQAHRRGLRPISQPGPCCARRSRTHRRGSADRSGSAPACPAATCSAPSYNAVRAAKHAARLAVGDRRQGPSKVAASRHAACVAARQQTGGQEPPETPRPPCATWTGAAAPQQGHARYGQPGRVAQPGARAPGVAAQLGRPTRAWLRAPCRRLAARILRGARWLGGSTPHRPRPGWRAAPRRALARPGLCLPAAPQGSEAGAAVTWKVRGSTSTPRAARQQEDAALRAAPEVARGGGGQRRAVPRQEPAGRRRASRIAARPQGRLRP
jgi:hypothetical protein